MKQLSVISFTIIILVISVKPVHSQTTGLHDFVGTWEGDVQVSYRNADDEPIREEMRLTLKIDNDLNVTGSLGNAKIRGCVLNKNRGKTGRKLNIKTDFIITGGVITGPLSKSDPVTQRKFTLPFNLKDENMRGSIMQIYKWKYPYPLCHVELEKIQ